MLPMSVLVLRIGLLDYASGDSSPGALLSRTVSKTLAPDCHILGDDCDGSEFENSAAIIERGAIIKL